MARRVVWTPEAEKKLEEILAYWKHRNRSNVFSKKLLLAIISTSKFAAINPKNGKLTSLVKFRTMKVNNYRIVYEYDEITLVIVSVQDLRQEYLKP